MPSRLSADGGELCCLFLVDATALVISTKRKLGCLRDVALELLYPAGKACLASLHRTWTVVTQITFEDIQRPCDIDTMMLPTLQQGSGRHLDTVLINIALHPSSPIQNAHKGPVAVSWQFSQLTIMPRRGHLVVSRTVLRGLALGRMSSTPVVLLLLLVGLERRFARPRSVSMPVRRQRRRRVACLVTTAAARGSRARAVRQRRWAPRRGQRRCVHALRVHVVRVLLDRVSGVLVAGGRKGRRGPRLLVHLRRRRLLVRVGRGGGRVAGGGRRSLTSGWRRVRVLLVPVPPDEDDAEDEESDHGHSAHDAAHDGADGCR